MKRAIRNSFVAKVLSLALFILVVFPTIPAYSSTIDQVLYDSYTPGIGGGGYQPFLLFDSSLGTLNRVDVTIDISLEGIDPSGTGIFIRSSFVTGNPFGYLFYYGETMVDGVYHREWSNTNGTITGNVPAHTFYPPINWIYSSGNNGVHYQDISDISSVTVQSTTHLIYDYSPVPIPGAVWLFGSGLLGLVGIGRKRLQK